MPNQCDVLHPIYGVHDRCLCNERAATSILKQDIKFLVDFIDEYCPISNIVTADFAYVKYASERLELIKKRYLNQGI